MIVQSASEDGRSTDITFTLDRADLDKALLVLEGEKGSIGHVDALADSSVVKISVIGVGMRSHAGVASRMFETLAEKGINILVISTSEIKVSVLIEEEYAELACGHSIPPTDSMPSENTTNSVGGLRLNALSRRGCDLLGTDRAILGGAMTWVSEHTLVSAISNSGGLVSSHRVP